MPNIPEGAKRPSDRLKAETTATDAGEISADFKGQPIRVLPFLDWDKDAVPAINVLNFAGWAACAVHPDDVATFNATKATVRETLSFIKDVAERGGGDLGELLAS